jgi:hypothetical protein
VNNTAAAASSILLTLSACAHIPYETAVSPGGHLLRESLTIFSTVLGQDFTCDLGPEILPAEPAWLGPGSGPPPVTIDEAVALSRPEISRYFNDTASWQVRSVELRSLCCPEKWYYIVNWLPVGATGDALGIPVLMSGQTVALTRDSEQTHERRGTVH